MLPGVVFLKRLMDLRWSGTKCENGQDVVDDVVVETSWSQVMFLVWSFGLEVMGDVANCSSL